ncbi:MAG: M14 family zinc carboxypeptidase [Acidobacteriota bacterium]
MPRFVSLFLVLLVVPASLMAHSIAGELPIVVDIAVPEGPERDALAADIDMWEHGTTRETVRATVDDETLDRLRHEGYFVIVDAKETSRLQTALERIAHPTEGVTGTIPGFPCYRDVEATLATAQELRVTRPDLVTLVDIGDSWAKEQDPAEGYDLLVVRITNSAVAAPPEGKPVFFLIGGTHSREYTPVEIATRFAERLVTSHGVDPDLTWIVDHTEVHILLNANPDGRKEAETGQLWRKNANLDFCGSSTWPGIDLNRNYTFQWGCCGGSTTSPCDQRFRGPSAGSEPETQAIMNYAVSVLPDQRPNDTTTPAPADGTGLMVDMHSFGEDVLWSWGFTTTQPPNGPELYSLGRKYAFFTDYRPQHGSLSTVDGSTKDFAYGELGVPGFTIEIGTTFFQDCATFTSTILPDNLAALSAFAKHSRRPYQTPQGPDVIDLTLNGDAVGVAFVGDLVTLVATADDTRFSTNNGAEPIQPVASATARIGAPSWLPGADIALGATDGTFDQTIEGIGGTLDTSGLPAGRQTVFVTATDTLGNTGAPTAAFLWLLDPATAPTVQGTVTDDDTGAPLDATVTIGLLTTTTDPATGAYSLHVPPGTWPTRAEAVGYGVADSGDVTAIASQTHIVDFALRPVEDILNHDAELGTEGWTGENPWEITSETANSPTRAWSDSPGGNYENNIDISLMSPVLDLTDYTNLELEFWHNYDLENGFDFGFVELSTNGGTTWQTLASYTDTSDWQSVSLPLDLSDAPTNQIRLRFRLDSDFTETRDGWYVDDIVIRGIGPSAPPIFVDGFESGDVSAWSSVVN